MTKIKICGLYRREDIGFVNEARPDYAGFVIDFPKSHRSLTPERAYELRLRLLHGIVPVGVFVDEDIDTVADLYFSGVIKVAQLHGGEDEAYMERLRRAAPGLTVWKAYSVKREANLVLLDNGQGTGRSFDWSILAAFRRPFILAGGLTPESIPLAVGARHPWGVDLSAGVETNRVKDRDKIMAAVGAVRKE